MVKGKKDKIQMCVKTGACSCEGFVVVVVVAMMKKKKENQAAFMWILEKPRRMRRLF